MIAAHAIPGYHEPCGFLVPPYDVVGGTRRACRGFAGVQLGAAARRAGIKVYPVGRNHGDSQVVKRCGRELSERFAEAHVAVVVDIERVKTPIAPAQTSGEGGGEINRFTGCVIVGTHALCSEAEWAAKVLK